MKNMSKKDIELLEYSKTLYIYTKNSSMTQKEKIGNYLHILNDLSIINYGNKEEKAKKLLELIKSEIMEGVN